MSAIQDSFDVVVIGGGHAGIEAAHAAWKIGVKTAMITMDLDAIGRMSCNPAVGGVSKGQIVRDIDAMGGLMGLLTDKAGIQFRMLNLSKGPAVWGPRAQCDLKAYSRVAREALENCKGLHLIQGELAAFDRMPNGKMELSLLSGERFETKTLVITSGTFLASKMFTGLETSIGGRVGEPSADALSKSILSNGLRLRRLKTGTPSRLDPSTINFDILQVQPGDENPWPMSDRSTGPIDNGNCCWITRTNLKTHDILRSGFKDSPMFSGRIKGKGPRYCPSIEDKINRFGDKDGHQLFLEPETKDVERVYLNGFSSSLPADIQLAALHTITGLEKVRVMQIGYAVEYDSIDATQLYPTFECKTIPGLYFAGQVCGTSGYEEAAGQGIMAGINAAMKLEGREPLIFRRDEAYIGVLIDDLTTKGTLEPYRLLTSRAEFRLLLRHDNAEQRLIDYGRKVGLISDARYAAYEAKMEKLNTLENTMKEARFHLDDPRLMEILQKDKNFIPEHRGESGYELLKRPGITTEKLMGMLGEEADEALCEKCDIEIKYKGYIEKARREAQKLQAMENIVLGTDFDYDAIEHLSLEGRQKLKLYRPMTIGQASRISGVSPADIAVIAVALKQRKGE